MTWTMPLCRRRPQRGRAECTAIMASTAAHLAVRRQSASALAMCGRDCARCGELMCDRLGTMLCQACEDEVGAPDDAQSCMSCDEE